MFFIPKISLRISTFHTFKFGSVNGCENAMPMEPTLHEFTLIFRAVWKPHHAQAIWQAFIELAFICGSIWAFHVAFATFDPIIVKVTDVS